MRLKHVAMMVGAGALALQAMSGAMAQAMLNAPPATAALAPVRLEGAQLRRVYAPESPHLTYEYQTGAGISRISVDPTSLMNDIERARKRAPQKKASLKSAATPAMASPTKVEARPSEMAQASTLAQTTIAASEPVAREDRKVRVIPLYKAPDVD